MLQDGHDMMAAQERFYKKVVEIRDSLPIKKKFTGNEMRSIFNFLEAAFRNTLQHGRRRYDPVNVKVNVEYENDFLIIKVVNPKLEEFPKRLERIFHKGDHFDRLEKSELGFGTSAGTEHLFMIGILKDFPDSSTIEWKTTETEVIVELRVSREGQNFGTLPLIPDYSVFDEDL